METQELEFGTQGHILVTVIVPNVALVPDSNSNVVSISFLFPLRRAPRIFGFFLTAWSGALLGSG